MAGLRLEKEQAKLDKALMRRLEADLAELKTLSTAALNPFAGGADVRHHVDKPTGRDAADFGLADPEVEAAAAYLRSAR